MFELILRSLTIDVQIFRLQCDIFFETFEEGSLPQKKRNLTIMILEWKKKDKKMLNEILKWPHLWFFFFFKGCYWELIQNILIYISEFSLRSCPLNHSVIWISQGKLFQMGKGSPPFQGPSSSLALVFEQSCQRTAKDV